MNRERSRENRLINKDIGKKIADCQKRVGMTQAQLSQIVGLSTAWVQQIEYGNSEPSLAKIIIFAEALGVTPQELFSEDSQCKR